MKVYICQHYDWEHSDIMRIYKDEISAKIWRSQIKERLSKGEDIPDKEFGGWYSDGRKTTIDTFDYDEYDVI